MMLLYAFTLVLAAKTVTLDEVKTASRRNLNSIRAEVVNAQAQAGKTVAISGILPHGSLQAGASYTTTATYGRIFTTQEVSDAGVVSFAQTRIDVAPARYPSFTAGISVTQLVYDARFWAQLAQAGALEEATRGELEEQRLASEAEAIVRFYEVLFTAQARKIYEDAVDRSKGQLTRAQAVFNAGKGHQHDILDARVNLGNDQISLLKWDQQITAAQADLTQWLAWSFEPVQATPPEILKQHPPRPAPTLERVLELAKQNRPLLRSVASRVRVSEAAIGIARSEYFPSVLIGAQYAREAPTGSLFIDPQRQHVLAVGATLNWNFFSGLATLGRDRSAHAELRLAEATQAQAMSTIEGDIAREYEVLKTALQIADVAEKTKDFAEEEAKLEEQRYTVGVGTNLDVRNAQLKLTQSQFNSLSARFDVEISRARLGRLAGVSMVDGD